MFALRPDHAGISVGDLETSIEWYREMLGFSLEAVVDVPEDTGKVALLRQGDFILELFCLPDASPLPEERRHPWTDIRTHGVKHVAYAVENVETLVTSLKQKGVDVVWDTRVHDGVTCAFVRDNTGNLVEFVERP
ncbi:MAG: VOC family protein [Actinobacteria bacterium]|nr:VOC family protein [Actinomycetota bacterium]